MRLFPCFYIAFAAAVLTRKALSVSRHPRSVSGGERYAVQDSIKLLDSQVGQREQSCLFVKFNFHGF